MQWMNTALSQPAFAPASTGPVITFLGAAQSVTGSMHLVEHGRSRVLLDCGKARGRRDDTCEADGRFPFEPASLDAVILSHAHADHCGNLPNLVRQGFNGPIFCTPPTRDLLAIILADSARIQEEDAAVDTIVHGPSRARPALFTLTDACRTIDLCVGVPYGKAFSPAADCKAHFLDAGHILGSAITALTFTSGGRTWRVTFTGDLGRHGLPFVRPPSPVPAADVIISESTYGGRFHDTVEAMAAKLSEVVRTTAARGGRVLIPSFSLGRTQLVLHYLRGWMHDGLLPELPLIVDSPLAKALAEVHVRHRDCLAADFDETGTHYVATAEEHRDLARQTGPAIVIASGGMCEGGRIVGHLKHHVDDPRDSIVLVSYQAPQTPGAQLLEKAPTVRFHGRTWNKWADVVHVNGFSGHADHGDFVDLLAVAVADTGRVCLVHGEIIQAEALAATLREEGFREVLIPERSQSVVTGP
jgi:metallo-beta-lactamase family protein